MTSLPHISRDARDLVIQALAADCADLEAQLADAIAARDAYQILAVDLAQAAATLTETVRQQKNRIALLCDRTRLEAAMFDAMESAA